MSRDDLASHDNFITKFDLNMSLLADESGAACEAYGVWRQRERDGQKSMGIERSTFVIAADGNLALILRAVDPAAHIAEVETFIRDNLR